MATFYHRKCMIVIGIYLLMPAFSAMAQQQYSLQNLIDASKNYLPVLKQKQALVNSARASVTDVKHSFLPQVKLGEQLNIGSDNSLAGSYFTFGITPSASAGVRADNNLQTATGNLAVLYSEYELVNFGLNSAKLKYAKSFADLQEADWQKEQYLIALQVARLYFATLKTQYRLDADRQNVNRYDSVFRIIQALTASGLKAGSDSSLAKAELSKTRITYNQTLGNLNQLKEQLTYFTGVPAGQLRIDSLANSFIIHTPLPLNLQPDTANNPLIDYYVKRKNIFLRRENLINKSYLPKILLAGSTWARGSSIQYSDQYKSLGTGLGYQRFNYALGVAVTYNLFNGLYKKDKLTVNWFDTQASDYELEQQKESIHSALAQSENALQTTQSNLAELPIQLKSAFDTYRQKLAQYKAGIISLIDLTNASFVLYRSQTDYIETISDWYLSQLNKAALTGNLTQFIQTIK